MTAKQHFTTNKPTKPGAYWVRGYKIFRRSETSLVELRKVKGVLCSNIHCCNTDHDDEMMPISDHSNSMEWCGPLVQAA